MINPDEKVEKDKKKREGLYQSSQHPEHFKNEGAEHLDLHQKENNDISKNADYDKAHGINANKDKSRKK
ncbi:hypothetical protein RCC89_02690 [Cytophagaceae bacterium ABcell3]|nr:hypothetical protein RCC89_02690 [Cytophagaceae bacterium ABcell3]